jgi:hypothetical protein
LSDRADQPNLRGSGKEFGWIHLALDMHRRWDFVNMLMKNYVPTTASGVLGTAIG